MEIAYGLVHWRRAGLVHDEAEYAHVVSTQQELAVAENLLDRLAPDKDQDERNRVAYASRRWPSSPVMVN